MAHHLGAGADELDDIVQDIFVVIYERLSTLERPEALRSWIFGIIRRVVSSRHRSKHTDATRAEMLEIVGDALVTKPSTPHQLVEKSEQAALLWALLDELDAQKREVFVLSEIQELTAPEIAAAIDIPISTVYSRLRFARQEMEEALKRYRARAPKHEDISKTEPATR